MRYYGGNSKRFVKKHMVFYQDGVQYNWNQFHNLLDKVRRLHPGDIIYNPYHKEWNKVLTVEFFTQNIWVKPRVNDNNRYIKGWCISEFIIRAERDNKEVVYIYDIEHNASWQTTKVDENKSSIFEKQMKQDYYPWNTDLHHGG